jgi:ABC-type molybdate transport system substrate-binding protein
VSFGSFASLDRRPRAAAVIGVGVLLVAAIVAGVASCGGGGGGGGGAAASSSEPIVFADTALKVPFTHAQSANVRAQQSRSLPWMGNVFNAQMDGTFTYGASTALAARIRKGARPDVFAGSAAVLDAMYTAGLVQEPIRFTSVAPDQISLAKRSTEARLAHFPDFEHAGVRLALGTPTSRVGRDARRAIDHLPAGERRAILANVRVHEPSAAAIIADVKSGKVDAGFVYGSDAHAACCKQKRPIYEVGMPPAAQIPNVEYSAAIVVGATHLDAAKLFLYSLLDGNSAGSRGLTGSGYGPAPPIAHRPRKPPAITRTGV